MPKLFGTSGIRGITNRELTAELALKVGLALATKHEEGKFLIARDTRVSGEFLENALISGILSAGANVTKLGIVPTPVLAYLTMKYDFDCGVMITASHNPPQYNGIKIDHLAYSFSASIRRNSRMFLIVGCSAFGLEM